jgi:CPA2 family monovalent cation:H+ antiporter-2
MDIAGTSLQPILILLAAAVLAVAACRLFALPPILGYLSVGLALGPNALGVVADDAMTRHLAEIGVVFLMFSIGLEFSLSKLRVMRREVFGLGSAQVLLTVAACVGLSMLVGGGDWQSGLAIGGVLSMSSTAVITKLLAERMELETAHGRAIMGVLLFQDLAVVPLLILIPVLAQPATSIGMAIAVALAKAAFVLAALLLAGPRVMRAWFGLVARRKSTELFVLNVLLVILAMAFVTGLAGLSLALGAFLAGMLISETEYRYRVEDEIKPFRDVLLGLFFVTVGMMLDPGVVAEQPRSSSRCSPRWSRSSSRWSPCSRARSVFPRAERCASAWPSRRAGNSVLYCSRKRAWSAWWTMRWASRCSPPWCSR